MPFAAHGETGKGQTAKIGMNLMIALIYEGFAEALVLTSKLGLPPENLLQLVEQRPVSARAVCLGRIGHGPASSRRSRSPHCLRRLGLGC